MFGLSDFYQLVFHLFFVFLLVLAFYYALKLDPFTNVEPSFSMKLPGYMPSHLTGDLNYLSSALAFAFWVHVLQETLYPVGRILALIGLISSFLLWLSAFALRNLKHYVSGFFLAVSFLAIAVSLLFFMVSSYTLSFWWSVAMASVGLNLISIGIFYTGEFYRQNPA